MQINKGKTKKILNLQIKVKNYLNWLAIITLKINIQNVNS